MVDIKKLLPVLLLFLFLIPSNEVSAYDGGLLNGKTMYTSSDLNLFITGDEVTTVTDNDETTRFNLNYGTSPSAVKHLWYKFDNPSIIDGYVRLMTRGSIAISFYNSEQVEIYTTTISGHDDLHFIELSRLEDVTYINLTNLQKEGLAFIFEFDVFGETNEPLEYLAVENLNYETTFNTINLSWDNPSVRGFDSLIVKKDGTEVAQLSNNAEEYLITGLTGETDYNIEVIAKYIDGAFSESVGFTVTTDTPPEDIIPPSEIRELSIDVTSTTVNATYLYPLDSDFSHLRIYRNNVLIEPDYRSTTFNDTNLVPNTSYTYKFVSVDESGNHSSGHIQTIMTDSEIDSTAPLPPTGVYVTEGNASARAIWNANPENDLYGYYVYVNGTRQNTSILLSTSFVITGLENGQTYTLSISAVDTSGNESELTEPISFTPSELNMPIFTAQYDLTDVAKGTSNWFGSLWPILAFSVGLVLAFIVSNRVKELFLA